MWFHYRMKFVMSSIHGTVTEFELRRKTLTQKEKPTVLYFLPRLYGAEDKLKPAESRAVDICEEECTRKSDFPCDETVFELCTLIMTEMHWEFPSENCHLSDLY